MIPVPLSPTLRPSPDRVRETLFNWLQPVIADANCLDLFAGSGVLGIEAISRGAKHAVLVDRDHKTVLRARALVRKLGSDAITVIEADALTWLKTQTHTFTIVFLDPPFGEKLLARSLAQLYETGALVRRALIYMENNERWQPPLPELKVIKKARAGRVHYALLEYLP